MALLETGNAKWRKKVTGQLLFKRSGAVDYVNFGNVRLHAQELTAERSKIMVARKGYVETVSEQVAQLERRFKVGLDEELPEVTRLDLLAAAHTATNQSSGTGATESFVGVKQGNVLVLAKQDVTAVVVEVATVAKTLGTDYTLDAKAGTITILRGGTIAEGATVDVDYNHAAINYITHTTNGELRVAGDMLFLEFDQNSEIPRARWSATAEIILSNRGDNDGKKFSEFEAELLITGTLTKKELVQA